MGKPLPAELVRCGVSCDCRRVGGGLTSSEGGSYALSYKSNIVFHHVRFPLAVYCIKKDVQHQSE